jgi:hypothetical protein
MKAEKQELAVIREMNPMSILQSATEQGAGIDVIERLSALAERWQDRTAQEKFAEALAMFQSLCPTVFKGRTASIRSKDETKAPSCGRLPRS